MTGSPTDALAPPAALSHDAPPRSVEAFHARLAEMAPRLPKRLAQCADHIAAHADRIAVSTVAELSAGAGVPPSALMRFCQIMGFAGFSDMQRLFRDAYSPAPPDYATRLANLKGQGAGSPAALLAEFIEAGHTSLESLAKSVDEAALSRAVTALAKARVIHLAGFRRAFPVASYLAYVFEKLALPSLLHDGAGGLDAGQAMAPGDALLAVSFEPYSEETLALAEKARARGLSVIALTDRQGGPLGRLSDHSLTVTEADFGSFRTLSATLALALSVAVAVASARSDG